MDREDLQRRAGISTGWDLDMVMRHLKTVDGAIQGLRDQFDGMEDEHEKAAFLNAVGELEQKLIVLQHGLRRYR